MKIENKTGLFFRAIAVGDTEFRASQDPKMPHSYVTPCAAGKSFGDAVQRVANQADLRWTPKVGHRGSLTQNQENDPHVEETSSAQRPV